MGKTRRRTNDDVMNSYVDNYRAIVNRGATIREVVEYGLEKGQLKLPKPKSPKEILVQRFTKAQRTQMSFDDVLKQTYSTNICYLFGDEVRWINQDSADLENFISNSHLKRTIAVGILTGVERNRRHWNRTRTDDEHVEEPEFDLRPDVLWNLNQPKDEEGTGTGD